MKRLTTLCCLLVSLSLSAQLVSSNTNTYAASGDAIIRVQPDQVVLQLGLESKGKDLVQTKEQNANTVKKAIDYCKSKGIPAKHIQTDYVSIRPSYNRHTDLQVDHYNVTQILCVVIENVQEYETMLTDLLLMGINRVDRVEFRTTKIKEHRKKARKMAIAAAKEKAEFLAGEVGIKLGDIINVSEYTAMPGSSFGRSNYANFSQNVIQDAGSSGTDSSLSVGLISVKAQVTLTYSLD